MKENGEDGRRRGASPAPLREAARAVLAGEVGKLASLLRDHPALVEARMLPEDGEPRNTLLHLATGMGEVAWPKVAPRVAELLLAAGAEVDAPETAAGGETPLHHAVSVNNVKVAAVLLDHGADPEAPGRHRDGLDTALGYALFYGQDIRLPRFPEDAPALLVRRGARITLPFAAALGDAAEVERRLTGSGAGELAAALIFAALWGRDAVVAQLLGAGAAAGGEVPFFHWRATPLHAAAVQGHGAVAERLLAAGADPGLADGVHGAHAAAWAAHGGHPELAARLRAADG